MPIRRTTSGQDSGDSTRAPLEQAGTSRGVSGIGTDQAWEEFLPSQPHPDALPLYATQSEYFSVVLKAVPQSPGYEFTFYLSNNWTKKSYSGDYKPTSWGLSTAEAIMERPVGYDLGTFTTPEFYAYDTIAGTTSTRAYADPESDVLVNSSGKALADVSNYQDIGGSLSSWTVHFVSCS